MNCRLQRSEFSEIIKPEGNGYVSLCPELEMQNAYEAIESSLIVDIDVASSMSGDQVLEIML